MTNNNDDIMIHGFESEDILNRLHVDVPLFGGEGNDTLDSGEALSPTASAGLVERKGQRLGAGDPTMMIGLGVDLFGLAAATCSSAT